MSVWLERFVLAVLASIAVALFVNNPWRLTPAMKWGLAGAVVVVALMLGVLIERMRARRDNLNEAPVTQKRAIAEGSGGRGGGGNAVGRASKVVGGSGGVGGAFGRGGDGGGGDALGEGATVIGGDGGDAGRIDGRGGKGGQSPLKKLSPETLRSFGLTGNEGYGQGGRAPNSPEYNRRVRVLARLSNEFDLAFPDSHLEPMPGVLMPPLAWVNRRLGELGENFEVELIDNNTDFLLHNRPAG